MHLLSGVVAAALLLAPASGQTFTKCNPMKRHCPADPGLNRKHYEVDFVRQGKNGMKDWKVTAGSISHGPKGAGFTLAKRGDAPTMQTKFNIFFGRAEATMLAAPGQGVVSSFILESDDLDEIDWEWVGSDHAQGQSNFFGKGNTTTYDRGAYHPVSGPQVEKHTYGIDWTKERIQWLVNGRVVRTIHHGDPLALHGRNYPQTPMTVRLGIWAGGDPSNSPGTIQWAGGPINYNGGPYSMHLQKLKVTNYNPAQGYKYKNKSGSWKSIQKLHKHPKADSDGQVERTHHPQVANHRPGPAISYSYESSTVTPTVTSYAPPATSYPAGNTTYTYTPPSNGTYPTGSPSSTYSPTAPPSTIPTAAAGAVHAQLGGVALAILGFLAFI